MILVTQKEYEKGEAIFAEADFEIRPAPAAEAELAREVLRRGAHAVILGIERYRGPLYEALAEVADGRPALLARFGVGHDGIDKDLSRRYGILVTNTPGVLDQSVAEQAIWLLGSLARHVTGAERNLREGRFYGPVGVELGGKKLGILGLGMIGRRVAHIAHYGLGMEVLACNRRSAEELGRGEGIPGAEWLRRWGVARCDPDPEPLLELVNAVSIHLPATAETTHFLDAHRLNRMRPGSLLVNTARGSIVDERALYDALASGRLGGAALDVFQTEPYVPAEPDKDLRRLENVVLTPHIGSNTGEANRRMAEAALANVRHFLEGQFDRLTQVG